MRHAAVGGGEQVPHVVFHRRAVGVDEDLRVFVVVAGDVDVVHPRHIDGVEEIVRREQPVVHAVHIDVVDVQMDAAVGFLRHGVEKFGFVHFRQRAVQVVGGVFHRDAAAEEILHLADAAGGVAHAVGGEGQRQQVVQMPAEVLAVAQVVGKEGAAVAAHHVFDAGEQFGVQRGLPAQREGQPVQGQRQAFGGFVEAFARRAAHFQPVFGRGFDKGDGAVGGQVKKIVCQVAAVAESGAV